MSTTYTYGNQHPKILEAGERLQQSKDLAYEKSKNTKHIFALVQDFYDKIGHNPIYNKEYFTENKERILDKEPFHITSDKFSTPQLSFTITSIRLMAKYAEITIFASSRNSRNEIVEVIKFKYDTYIKNKNDISTKFSKIIEWNNIPNNNFENEARKNIWEFNFKKIDFSAKPQL